MGLGLYGFSGYMGDGGQTAVQILLYLCQLNKTIEQKHNCTSNFSSNFWLDKWPVEPKSIEPIYIKQN